MNICWQCHTRLSLYVVLFVLNASLSLSQSLSVTGKVVDAATRQPVAQAIIEIRETGQRKTTDNECRFLY